MSSFNKVFLMGNLTRDLEIRYTPGGVAVTTIGLAVNQKFGKGDDAKEEALFVDVTVFGKTAENCTAYLSKGSPIFVEGRMKLDMWNDKETGAKRSKISVTALSVQFLSSGKGKQEDYTEQAHGASRDQDGEVPF